MPRARKTMSGAPAQEIKSVTGQRYGEGVAQAEMQRQMPAPNAQASTTSSPAQQPQSAPVPQQQISPQDALRNLPTRTLRAPDQRPVTSGLSFGAGRGPEALGAQTSVRRPSTRMLELLYNRTNDPVYANLLNRLSK